MQKPFYLLILTVFTVASGDDLNGYCEKNPKVKNCDESGVPFYEDLGCIPTCYDENGCPIKYDCTLEQINGTCLFRNHYYEVDEFIPDELLEGTCRVLCFCQEDGRFVCAILDCFFRPDPGCYLTYDLIHCCRTGQNCPTDNETITKCYSSGQEYLEGERIYREETCDVCICNKDFNKGRPECQRRNLALQLDYRYYILNKCAPVYYSTTRCYPDDWICPTGQVIIPISEPCSEKSDWKCQFGNTTVDYGYGFETFSGWSTITCECKLPPFLTCNVEI